jgi:glutamate-1-semialdehyde 2,1-aminomutase
LNELFVAGAVAAALAAPKIIARLRLSRAKHRSLTGHAKISRQFARQVPYYEYDEEAFLGADDADAGVVSQRRAALSALTAVFRERFPKSVAATDELEPGVSDLQFTSRYRVPFQFRSVVGKRLSSGSVLAASHDRMLVDLDGNESFDLTGSYGVNVFGYDFYKGCMERAAIRARPLGPVLGGYHPVLAYVVRRLREISGLEEVSFHMSGTEAVMQAVRLARYQTGRTHLVRFAGAYHGWWGDVQPGVGNPQAANETYTLADLSERSLAVLETRRDIACVLVNPLQALHPNAGAPADSSLVDSGRRGAFDRSAYTAWLQRLRDVCSRRGIVLIFDEVFVGFRLALGGAQEYFGVRADLVTYGKTLGGGYPVGVLCGRAALMKRWRDDRPADICFARGTFNSHPYVVCAMAEFLEHIEKPEVAAVYARLDAVWNGRVQHLNATLEANGLPLRIANLSTIWTLWYTTPCRYNWMLQYYLRAEGLSLSWVGTGRLIFSLDYTDEEYDEVARRIVSAARKMRDAGWWWEGSRLTNKDIRRRVFREMLQAWWRPPIGSISSPRSKWRGAL